MREPWYWVTEDTKTFLQRGYNFKEGETVPERVAAIAQTAFDIQASKVDPDFREKFIKYMSLGYYSLASPVWSNFGRAGLPISCNNVFVGDTVADILWKQAEVGMQTKHGAGTSAYLGALRPRGTAVSTGGTADGPAHFARLFDNTTDIISQGSVRRGSCAVYLDVDHPDIEEFLEFREIGNLVKNLSLGICITDKFLEDLPTSPKNQKIWIRILRKRFETGYPYLFFTDTVNKNKPQIYKDLDYKIYSSNLCTEIMLPSSTEESFVCDLSSMNLENFDSWALTDAVETLTLFLDCVMEEYIQKTATIRFMEASRNFAMYHRAIGIGSLGLHSYFQSKMIPFDSLEARRIDTAIHQIISERSFAASVTLGQVLGFAPIFGEDVTTDIPRRNTTLMAIAPTMSSSFILGQVSASVEPLTSNYFVNNLAKGNFTYRNPYLIALLKEKGQDTDEVWQSVLIRGGSVQHLEFLTDHEKNVFKTFGEIPQIAVVQAAIERQPYIDQGQSLNLYIHPDTPPRDLSRLMLYAWRGGLKSLYYQKSANVSQQLARDILTCESCSA